MDRATKAIKRGSIRLKSYSEINLILSDLNDIRSAGKTSVQAHQTFIEDLLRWANQESNESIKNSFSFLTELNLFEQTIDKARSNVSNCEQIEVKLNKELKKSVERFGNFCEESRKLEEKVRDAKRTTEIAKLEVTQKDDDNKINKLIRIKEGLKKLTESYAKLSQKCTIVMHAQKIVVNQLPDDMEINQNLQITTINNTSHPINISFPEEYDAPPPYSPDFATSTSSLNRSNLPSTSSDVSWYPHLNSSRKLIDCSGCSDQPRTYVCCKCSAQMISDHKYLPVEDIDTEVADRLQNTRISGRTSRRGRRGRR
ncbi:hypothetical protein PGB90_009341 [Kerria lacca]